MRRVFLLKKHHAVFAQRDQHILGLPFFEQHFAGTLKIDIYSRSVIWIAPRNASRKESFGAVRFHHCYATPIDSMSRIGIRCDHFTLCASIVRNLRHQLGRQEAFAVIFEDDRVDLRETLPNRCDDFCNLCRRRSCKLLAINTDHLLVARDYPGFYNGVKRLLLDGVGDVDLSFGQQLTKLLATVIQALLHGLGMQAAADPDAFDRQQVLSLCIDMLGSYMKIQPRARKPRKSAANNGQARNGVRNGRNRSSSGRLPKGLS